MGIIDSAHYRLSCPQCGEQETVSANDKGSGWGGSNWQNLNKPTNFNMTQDDNGHGPRVTSASCKHCKVDATWKSAMYNKPKGW